MLFRLIFSSKATLAKAVPELQSLKFKKLKCTPNTLYWDIMAIVMCFLLSFTFNAFLNDNKKNGVP